MHKNATKCNETIGKWCKNKHGASKIIDTFETYQEDRWLGATSLREQYPVLYNIVQYKGDTIAEVLETSPPNVSFRRDLLGQRLVSWNTLLLCLANTYLQPGHDEFRWNLPENSKFSVAFMYNGLIQPDIPFDKVNNNRFWKLKIPLRIKVFGWYLRKGVILTKDNLAKRNWHDCRKCVFCPQDETIKHLFFQCRFARSVWSVIQVASTFIWSLWLCRNDKVFNDKKSSMLQVIYRGISTLCLWSSLQRAEDRDLFTEVCERLEGTASDTFSQHGWPHSLRIGPSV
jgi:hypothetical protein